MIMTTLTYVRTWTSHAGKRRLGARGAVPLALAMAAAASGGLACGGETPPGDEPIRTIRAALGSTEQQQDISTLAQLRAMTPTGNYRLVADITMQPWHPAFVPIGGSTDSFRGTFDGNTFKIYNLRVVGGQYPAGMFGALQDAILRKVALVNVNISGSASVGAIAGQTLNSEVTDSYVEGGTVTGTNSTSLSQSVGMAIGFSTHATQIRRCYATGTVTGRAGHIGGFVGRIFTYGEPGPYENPQVKIEEVFTNVNVNPTIPSQPGDIYAGGLVGSVFGADIQGVNVVGDVLGRGYAGGVVGYIVNNEPASSASTLRDTISRGIVTVSGVMGRAGAIGFAVGNFANCGGYNYWDTDTDSGSPPSMDDPGCQQGKTSNQLKSPRVFPSPKVLGVYIHGELVTQAVIDGSNGQFLQCHLGSGTDGDWGFGTCGAVQTWAANSSSQYNTLTRIPNPSIQPK